MRARNSRRLTIVVMLHVLCVVSVRDAIEFELRDGRRILLGSHEAQKLSVLVTSRSRADRESGFPRPSEGARAVRFAIGSEVRP